jgi:hypothetical protein
MNHASTIYLALHYFLPLFLTLRPFSLSIPAAEKIVSHPALVLALKDVLLSEQETHRVDGSPRSHASATLMVLERSITPDMDSYETLRDLLDAISPNLATTEDDESDDMLPIQTTAV